MSPTIIIELEGKEWRVTGLHALDLSPLDQADERRGVARYVPQAERDEAREWVRRLASTERVLTCVYCGHAYPPGTPEHGAEVLTAHIKACEKHPMRAPRVQLARLESQLEFLYNQGCCVKLKDGRVATLHGAIGIDQTALALGWTPEKGGEGG